MEKKTKKTKKELSKKQRQSCNGGWYIWKRQQPRKKPEKLEDQARLAGEENGALESAIADTQNLLNNLKELKKSMK